MIKTPLKLFPIFSISVDDEKKPYRTKSGLSIQEIERAYWTDTNEEFKTLKAMEEFGGSFVKALGRTYVTADQINKLKLIITFIDYFDDYKKKGAEWL